MPYKKKVPYDVSLAETMEGYRTDREAWEKERAYRKMLELEKQYLKRPLGAMEQEILRKLPEKQLKNKTAPQKSPTPQPLHQKVERLVWYPRNHPEGNYSDRTVESSRIPYTNFRDLLAHFFIEAHLGYGGPGSGFNWRSFCIGITSAVFRSVDATQGHMPIFDYDGQNIKRQIRSDVKDLQEKHGLGPAWVYETRKGFHIYFFCDIVDRDRYLQMLREVKCCKGFRQTAERRRYGTLRVSAKYTGFDIKPIYVLPSKSSELKRVTQKGHLVQALLGLGEQCETHFASLFPQWAYYREDPHEWRQGKSSPSRGKRIRKVKATGAKLEYKPQFNEMITYTYTDTSNATTSASWPRQVIIKDGNSYI